MGLIHRGYLSISEAYEKIVATLEPHARPSDGYLLSLDEDERDAVFDSAHDTQKRAEKLFVDDLGENKDAGGAIIEAIGVVNEKSPAGESERKVLEDARRGGRCVPCLVVIGEGKRKTRSALPGRCLLCARGL
jgi:hypothetical protein